MIGRDDWWRSNLFHFKLLLAFDGFSVARIRGSRGVAHFHVGHIDDVANAANRVASWLLRCRTFKRAIVSFQSVNRG